MRPHRFQNCRKKTKKRITTVRMAGRKDTLRKVLPQIHQSILAHVLFFPLLMFYINLHACCPVDPVDHNTRVSCPLIECSAWPCFVVSVDLHHVAPMLSRVVCSCHMFLHVSTFYGCTVFPFTLVDMCGCLQERF